MQHTTPIYMYITYFSDCEWSSQANPRQGQYHDQLHVYFACQTLSPTTTCSTSSLYIHTPSKEGSRVVEGSATVGTSSPDLAPPSRPRLDHVVPCDYHPHVIKQYVAHMTKNCKYVCDVRQSIFHIINYACTHLGLLCIFILECILIKQLYFMLGLLFLHMH